jgi:hypothetical protein
MSDTQGSGHFSKGSPLDDAMQFLMKHEGIYFTPVTLSVTTGVSYLAIRGIITTLRKYDCVIDFTLDERTDHPTVFTVDADSRSRYYARLRD